MAVKKRPVGRPTKYDPAMCDMLEASGHNGEGMAEAIVMLGLGRANFYDYIEKYPEFANAVSEYRMRSQSWWEHQGRMATFGATPGYNATSFIFNMKNRFGEDWRDKHEVENKHDVTDALTDLLTAVAKGGKRIGT
jgi:hypothetical protein